MLHKALIPASFCILTMLSSRVACDQGPLRNLKEAPKTSVERLISREGSSLQIESYEVGFITGMFNPIGLRASGNKPSVGLQEVFGAELRVEALVISKPENALRSYAVRLTRLPTYSHKHELVTIIDYNELASLKIALTEMRTMSHEIIDPRVSQPDIKVFHSIEGGLSVGFLERMVFIRFDRRPEGLRSECALASWSAESGILFSVFSLGELQNLILETQKKHSSLGAK